jgi:uncharacterized protein
MSQYSPPADITSDDKLWALLAYLLTPIVPIIIMLMEDKKSRPFIKAHNAQALVAGVVYIILASVSVGCLSILWFVFLYWGIKAYQGNYVEIPVISNWCKNQGWA